MFLESLADGLQSEGYVGNRKELIDLVKLTHPDVDNGLIVLFGDFEKSDKVFRQESSFYYFSGITEPGVALLTDMEGDSKLFIPHCYEERAKWYSSSLTPEENLQYLGIQSVEVLGQKIRGHTIHPFFEKNDYENLLEILRMRVKDGGKLFVLNPTDSYSYVTQRLILDRIKSFVPEISDDCLIDISSLVTKLRRKKSIFEIEKITDAIDLTMLAHEAAAKAVTEDDALESEVLASVQYFFTAAGGTAAFPGIVATGKNATILHYSEPKAELSDGELVIVDIGADYDHYCADITRTYPVSGTFTDRQKEVYKIVLDTQKYIAGLAKPGYFLLSTEHEDKSLYHLAKKFLKERGGYDKYFAHGIGHYLGLDVHDVGDIRKPLEDGDVITIEPGVYIPEEEMGIRIEDNYWITKEKAVCLSEVLPKEIEDVERFVSDPEDFNLLDEDYN